MGASSGLPMALSLQTRSSTTRRIFHSFGMKLRLPVKYGSDHNLARQLILAAAEEIVGDYASQARESWRTMNRKFAVEDAVVEPTVFMVANDNWMEFTLRYVVDVRKRRSTKDAIYTHILDALPGTNGKVSIASSTFELVGAPALDISLRKT